MAQLVSEGQGPVLAGVHARDGGVARQVEAIPGGAHVDVAWVEAQALAGELGIRRHLGDHAPGVGPGPQVVAGVEADVRGLPVLAVLVDGDVAQGHLAIGEVVEEIRGLDQVRLQLVLVGGISLQVPLGGDGQVAQHEGISAAHGHGHRAAHKGAPGQQKGRAAGAVEDVVPGLGDGLSDPEGVPQVDGRVVQDVAIAAHGEGGPELRIRGIAVEGGAGRPVAGIRGLAADSDAAGIGQGGGHPAQRVVPGVVGGPAVAVPGLADVVAEDGQAEGGAAVLGEVGQGDLVLRVLLIPVDVGGRPRAPAGQRGAAVDLAGIRAAGPLEAAQQRPIVGVEGHLQGEIILLCVLLLAVVRVQVDPEAALRDVADFVLDADVEVVAVMLQVEGGQTIHAGELVGDRARVLAAHVTDAVQGHGGLVPGDGHLAGRQGVLHVEGRRDAPRLLLALERPAEGSAVGGQQRQAVVGVGEGPVDPIFHQAGHVPGHLQVSAVGRIHRGPDLAGRLVGPGDSLLAPGILYALDGDAPRGAGGAGLVEAQLRPGDDGVRGDGAQVEAQERPVLNVGDGAQDGDGEGLVVAVVGGAALGGDVGVVQGREEHAGAGGPGAHRRRALLLGASRTAPAQEQEQRQGKGQQHQNGAETVDGRWHGIAPGGGPPGTIPAGTQG